MLTLNVLLSLIIQSKRKGKGVIPNGRIFTELMLIISDFSGDESVLSCFNNETVKKEAYRKFERYLSRFLKDGKGFPYELFSFYDFENSIGDKQKMSVYLQKLGSFLDKAIDVEKTDSLVFTLLEIIKQDGSIKKILYGHEFIPKEKLFGSYAHKKQICIEALLLGLLYHVCKNPVVAESRELLEYPEKSAFKVVHFFDDDTLKPDMKIPLIENISDNSRYQKKAELLYPLEFECDNKTATELPHDKNLFVSGAGGAGKTTLLKSFIGSDNCISFYLPLNRYRAEKHHESSDEPCWIILNILLKYQYQYEYRSFESLVAGEGMDTVLNQFAELEKFLCVKPLDNIKKCILLLDGLNEIIPGFLSDFEREIEYISDKWQNVRIIIAGRSFSYESVFDSFEKAKIIGIPDKVISQLLSINDIEIKKNSVYHILKTPIFLNMYLQSKNSFITKGELLDECVWKMSDLLDDTERFMIRYSLPFAAKKLFTISYRREMTRSEFLEAVDESIDFYLMNDNVYQNYIAPERINKNALFESRAKNDAVDLLIKTGFLEVDETDPKYLHFIHDYYRDYFAARHIINLIEAAWSVYDPLMRKLPDCIFKTGITDFWYGSSVCSETDIVYELIGEICGDYANNGSEEYTYTLLDYLLEMCRSTHGFLVADNVIRTMKISRNNLICGVDFSDLRLPPFMYEGVKFSNNGENPCDFRKCIIPFWHNIKNIDFTGCDFSGAVYFDENVKERLAELGAII